MTTISALLTLGIFGFNHSNPGTTVVFSGASIKNEKEVFAATYHFEATRSSDPAFSFFKMEDFGLENADGKRKKGIGINFSWEEEPGRKRGKETYRYKTFLPKLKTMGVNFVRTWSCPWNLGFIWNSPKRSRKKERYNAQQLKKIDGVFETALNSKIHIMWCLDYHGALKEVPDYWGGNAYWPEHPYNVKNGGTCEKASNVFTDETAKQAYRDRLRYIIARWGYSPALGVIEFWNEIDNAIEGDTHPIEMEPIIEWHREMATYLNELDAYQRPVSTSLSHTISEALFGIPSIDFAQLHLYEQSEKLGEKLSTARSLYKKPTIVAEVGYDWRAPMPGQEHLFKNDLKLALWTSMFNKTPILPMAWWWELYNENNGLLLLESASEFACNIGDICNWNVEAKSLSEDATFETKILLSEQTCWIWVHLKQCPTIEESLDIPLGKGLPNRFSNRISSISWLDGEKTGSEFRLKCKDSRKLPTVQLQGQNRPLRISI